MRTTDWLVLIGTLCCIILYGIYKSRTSKSLDGYLLSDRQLPWYMVLLSIMGTQASAITFLSAPGQAYTDGMRFVQYYFGLPLAMVVLCITFVPLFQRLRVYTAYEFLERRFDVKTRTLTSFLFLVQRGLSTGISIYAPSIILSSLLGWNIYWTNVVMGGMLIIYTVAGGAKAVAYTQQLQLVIIIAGMFLAGYMVVHLLPPAVGFMDALHVSGKLGRLNVITSGIMPDGRFNWRDRYNLWNGLIGGFFLALSYFGTDQSQVGRYLTARSVSESRVGLLMNGLVKIPMQFLILLVGVLVFVFYQFYPAPIFFNKTQVVKVATSRYKAEGVRLQVAYDSLSAQKQLVVSVYTDALNRKDERVAGNTAVLLQQLNVRGDSLRSAYKGLLQKPEVGGDSNDTNYVFLRFVLDYLPVGMVGLLIAVIFLAAWGSIAAALNSLASTSVVDLHKQFINRGGTALDEYKLARWYTFGWGVFCIAAAQFASHLGSLIEAVNVLGSIFYGTILGVFLVAFYFRGVKGRAVFWAAVITEVAVILLFVFSTVGFLWLNLLGAAAVVGLSVLFEGVFPGKGRVV